MTVVLDTLLALAVAPRGLLVLEGQNLPYLHYQQYLLSPNHAHYSLEDGNGC